jgi:hypothetical protein
VVNPFGLPNGLNRNNEQSKVSRKATTGRIDIFPIGLPLASGQHAQMDLSRDATLWTGFSLLGLAGSRSQRSFAAATQPAFGFSF